MEVAKGKTLLKVVDESLSAIGRVVRGTELLGASTRAQGNALIKGEVPAAWTAIWEGPEAPVQWMKQAAARLVALEQWYEAARSGTLLRAPLKLHELLQPAAFLTALRQQTARHLRAPMDSLKLICALNDNELSRNTIGFSLQGLLLQGAACTPPQGLSQIATEDPTYNPTPSLHFGWVSKKEPGPYAADRSSVVPLYLTPERETLLAELRLPCTGSETQWVQAGVALFLGENN
eukprot:2605815-Pleurochrysis_carterae.AAC.2